MDITLVMALLSAAVAAALALAARRAEQPMAPAPVRARVDQRLR